MSSTDFEFPGPVGLLAAVLFVVTELFLLPLFELARECLTAAYLRHRLVSGKSVWIGCENKLAQWFAISDDVYMAGRCLALPRFLKTLLKLALLVSCFLFDLNIEPAKVATTSTYRFNGGGSYVMSPLPVDGSRYWYNASSEENNVLLDIQAEEGLGIVFPSWCTSTSHNQSSLERIVYFGIFNASDSSFVCLNGTEGRDLGKAFSYNPYSAQTTRSRFSSINITRAEMTFGFGMIYSAEVTLEGESDALRGQVGIWESNPYLHFWTMYGLFFHTKRGTIVRLNIGIMTSEKICNQTKGDHAIWLGTWTQEGDDIICPNQEKHIKFISSMQRNGVKISYPIGDVQDINLRLESKKEFVLAAPLEVLKEWMLNNMYIVFVPPIQFATELQEAISSDVFFFSGAKNDIIEFQTGPTVDRARVPRFPTIALLVSVTVLVLYCFASLIADWSSRLVTGISSNVLSRDACVRMLHDESVAQGIIPENKRFRLPVALKSSSNSRVRLTVYRRLMSKNADLDYPS